MTDPPLPPAPPAPPAQPPRLELVAALAANGVIGREGQLPWHLPDDLRHFKHLTLGHAIIRGRRTHESLGKALPGRQNIVVSQTLAAAPHAEVELARSLDEAVVLAAKSPPPAFVIGGAVLYAAALPRVQVMHLTELEAAVEGDTLFPRFDRSQWRLMEETRHDRDERHQFSFHFRRYQRVRGLPGKMSSPAAG